MSRDELILLLSLLAKYGLEVYAEARDLMTKTTVTVADMATLDALLAKTGESYFAPKA